MVFQTQVQSQSDEFKSRYRAMKSKVQKLKLKLNEVNQWGYQQNHPSLKKFNKLPVRKKIELLIDPSSYFMELSPLASHGLYTFSTPCAGLVTGIASVCGKECMIIANDPTVKGGAYLPLTVKKQLRAMDIALENHLPCIYLVDSGGAYLPEQSQIFPDERDFGAFFYRQSHLSAMGLFQISVVFGQCTAGGAYLPALSDETIMVKKQSALFLGGPPLVFSVTGEKVSAEELGGSKLHTQQSGVADYECETEEEALTCARFLLKKVSQTKRSVDGFTPKEPLYDPEEIYGLIPEDLSQRMDIKEILARIVDGSEWEEFKQNYGTTLFTAQTRLFGDPVGILANQGILFEESALKATHFIDLCDRENIPLIFFQNVPGFMVGKKYEQSGITKHGAKMVSAVSLARVPRFTVIAGASYGAGNYGMCGRAYRPRQLWMWPSGKIGVMGGKAARDVLSTIGKKSFPLEEQKK